ncbi:MAG: helix-turn-helix domain-containing protein [Pirellulales bacterium]
MTHPEQQPARMLLDAKAAAKTLSVSPRTLWGLSAPRGPIPTIRVARRVLYPVADLQRWIARNRVEGHEVEESGVARAR